MPHPCAHACSPVRASCTHAHAPHTYSCATVCTWSCSWWWQGPHAHGLQALVGGARALRGGLQALLRALVHQPLGRAAVVGERAGGRVGGRGGQRQRGRAEMAPLPAVAVLRMAAAAVGCAPSQGVPCGGAAALQGSCPASCAVPRHPSPRVDLARDRHTRATRMYACVRAPHACMRACVRACTQVRRSLPRLRHEQDHPGGGAGVL